MFRRIEATKLKTLLLTRDLDQARLAGFPKADLPRVDVLRVPGSTDAWLTPAQARDVSAAFEWAKHNVNTLDDQLVRMRSVKFRNRWYRGWLQWSGGWLRGSARQVFALLVVDGASPPTKLQSDRSEVIRVPSTTALFLPLPAPADDRAGTAQPQQGAAKSRGDPARVLVVAVCAVLIALANRRQRRRSSGDDRVAPSSG